MFCRFYQSAIQNDLDDFGGIRRPTLIHHLQKCSACRAFYHRIRDIESQLRTEPSCSVSDEQVERIRTAVQQRLAENTPTQSTVSGIRPFFYARLRYGLTAAAAMLIVSLLGVLYFNQTRQKQPDPVARFVNHTTVLQNQVAVLARLPEKSLQMEMQKLTGDARTAIDFFAGCIPSNPADTNAASKQNR